MKWIKRFLLCLFTILLPLNTSFINAENDKYPMECSLYEISHINDDGSLKKEKCYESYKDAKEDYKNYDDNYVIRNKNSLSATKIIEMKEGFVVSLPKRNSSLTLRIFELPSFKTDNATYTYVSSYYQMLYQGTHSVYDNGTGCIKVLLNGYSGYTDLEYTDLIPKKYYEKGIKLYIGSNLVLPKYNYFKVQENGKYKDLRYNYFLMTPKDSSGNPTQYGTTIGPAFDFMKTDQVYYSDDNYNFSSDPFHKNPVGKSLSYYQFLPLRTQTKIPASTMDNYIKDKTKDRYSALSNLGATFLKYQDIYGVNALATLCMGIHESDFGTHGFATKYYNFFGWSAYDSNPSNATHYNTSDGSIATHMGFNLTSYLNTVDWRHMGMSLGDKGSGLNVYYASDPYWSMKIASYMYDIDKYNNNYNGSLTDYNVYRLGIVNKRVDVKASASSNSNTLYKINAGKSSSYLQRYVVPIIEEAGEYTKVQTTNPISNNKTIYPSGDNLLQYNFKDSVGYLPSSVITPLNFSSTQNQSSETDISQPPVPEGTNIEIVSSVESVSLNNKTLTVSGYGILKGTNMDKINDIKHEVVLYSYETGNEAVFDAITSDSKGVVNLNDGYNYKYSAFKSEIDLSQMKLNHYGLKLRITKDGKSYDTWLKNNDLKQLNSKIDDKLLYQVSVNPLLSYRIEVSLLRTVLDYTSNSIPSNRSSLVSYDDISINKEGDIKINGQAMIYYIDYNDKNKVSADIYLINEKTGSSIKLDTEINKCKISYTEYFKSNKNLDYICFNVNDNINGFKAGDYSVNIQFKNDKYKDIKEVVNYNNLSLKEGNYSFYKGKTRDRLMFSIGE